MTRKPGANIVGKEEKNSPKRKLTTFFWIFLISISSILLIQHLYTSEKNADTNRKINLAKRSVIIVDYQISYINGFFNSHKIEARVKNGSNYEISSIELKVIKIKGNNCDDKNHIDTAHIYQSTYNFNSGETQVLSDAFNIDTNEKGSFCASIDDLYFTTLSESKSIFTRIYDYLYFDVFKLHL